MPTSTPPADQAPPFGRLDRPSNMTDALRRVDFDRPEFDLAIANHGYRMIWTRRAECPCAPSDVQITSPNLGCVDCSNTGYLYFGPEQPQDLSTQTFSPVQQAALDASGGFLLYALMMPLTAQDKRNDRLGGWLMGSGSVTVMPQNQLGFRDKLVNIDSLMPHTEVAIMPTPPSRVLPLRYLVSGGVHLCRDQNGKRYILGQDFTIDTGRLTFLDGKAPVAGTRISVFYITFPVWLVESTTHRSRVQNAINEDGVAVSPEGTIQQLPIQAQVSLEFIPSDINRGDR